MTDTTTAPPAVTALKAAAARPVTPAPLAHPADRLLTHRLGVLLDEALDRIAESDEPGEPWVDALHVDADRADLVPYLANYLSARLRRPATR